MSWGWCHLAPQFNEEMGSCGSPIDLPFLVMCRINKCMVPFLWCCLFISKFTSAISSNMVGRKIQCTVEPHPGFRHISYVKLLNTSVFSGQLLFPENRERDSYCSASTLLLIDKDPLCPLVNKTHFPSAGSWWRATKGSNPTCIAKEWQQIGTFLKVSFPVSWQLLLGLPLWPVHQTECVLWHRLFPSIWWRGERGAIPQQLATAERGVAKTKEQNTAQEWRWGTCNGHKLLLGRFKAPPESLPTNISMILWFQPKHDSTHCCMVEVTSNGWCFWRWND